MSIYLCASIYERELQCAGVAVSLQRELVRTIPRGHGFPTYFIILDIVLRVQGFVGRALGDPGLKPTVRVGEAAMREVAAYLLDHEHFARVPATALVKVGFPGL